MTRVRGAIGRFGEDRAAAELTAAGLQVLDRNWRVGGRGGDGEAAGEIDLVARDGSQLVFVEVKTRSGDRFGSPAAAVTAQKVARLRRLAARWLAAHPGQSAASVRFDVVSVLRRPGVGVEVEHVRGAF